MLNWLKKKKKVGWVKCEVMGPAPSKRQRVLVYRGYGEAIIMTKESANWHKAKYWHELPELP